jgi:hypothetical protein
MTDFNSAFGPDWLAGLSSMGKQQLPLSFIDEGSQPIINPAADALMGQALPNINPQGKGGFLSGFGMDEGKLALGGLQTLGQLYAAWQTAKMANKSYKQNKKMSEANYAMQMSAYNEALDGRDRTRKVVEGGSANQGYYDRFKARPLPA